MTARPRGQAAVLCSVLENQRPNSRPPNIVGKPPRPFFFDQNASCVSTGGWVGFAQETGHVGLASEGGGGSIEPPKSGGRVWEKSSIDWHH